MISSDLTFQAYWISSSFSYKFYTITSIILYLFLLYFPTLAIHLIDTNALATFLNMISLSISDQMTLYLQGLYNIESLFISFYGTMPVLESSINLVLQLIWIKSLLKDQQYGSLYTLIQVVVINFEVHVVYNLLIVFLAFTPTLTTSFMDLYLAYGWAPILLVYEFRRARQNPEQQCRFCFIPFTIKAKYFAWFIALVLAVCTRQIVCITAAAIVGCVQEIMMGSMIITLPFTLYSTIQRCIPKIIKNRYDYVQISNINQKALMGRCWKCFAPNQDVFKRGEGVMIGGGQIVGGDGMNELEFNPENIEKSSPAKVKNLKDVHAKSMRLSQESKEDTESKDSEDQFRFRDLQYLDPSQAEDQLNKKALLKE